MKNFQNFMSDLKWCHGWWCKFSKFSEKNFIIFSYRISIKIFVILVMIIKNIKILYEKIWIILIVFFKWVYSADPKKMKNWMFYEKLSWWIGYKKWCECCNISRMSWTIFFWDRGWWYSVDQIFWKNGVFWNGWL